MKLADTHLQAAVSLNKQRYLPVEAGTGVPAIDGSMV